jgi:hypothetical protein
MLSGPSGRVISHTYYQKPLMENDSDQTQHIPLVQLRKTAAGNLQEEIPKPIAGVEGLPLPIVFD